MEVAMRQFTVLLVFTACITIHAGQISLFDWGTYVNGNVSLRSTGEFGGSTSYSEDFWKLGLGTITMSFDGSLKSDYSVAWFFDYEIVQTENTFFNEYGTVNGTADARMSYEIDEPGFGSIDAHGYTGDIFDNFNDFDEYGFDGRVFYDSFTGEYLSDHENVVSEDVAMAMGWKFSLAENETAFLEYTVSKTAPTSGFYLAHLDRDAPETGVYLQSRLSIAPTAVPEPCTTGLVGIGMFCLLMGCSGKHRTAKSRHL